MSKKVKGGSVTVFRQHACSKSRITRDTNTCILPRQEGSRAIYFVKLASNQMKEIEK